MLNPEVIRAYGIGMRMKAFFSGRPSPVKYSALPLRAKRKPVCSLLPVVKVAASTGPVLISLPFKMLLFVLVDGWALVVGNLMGSFRQPQAVAAVLQMTGFS